MSRQKEQKPPGAEKVKTSLFHLIFSRIMLIILLLAVQLTLLVFFFLWLERYLPVIFGGYLFFGLWGVLLVLDKTETTSARLTWSIFILALPLVGVPMYIYTRLEVGNRLLAARLRELIAKTGGYLRQDKEAQKKLAAADPGAAGLAAYLWRTGGFPAYPGGDVRYFPSGEAKFEAMQAAIASAEHFIFLEYFIIEEGHMWNRILELLEQKASAGVEVRVLYDGTCAMGHLPYGYEKRLHEKGIQCRLFSPIRPVLSTSYNYRDHRKILVVDGRAAFTGGVNLADEYINQRDRFGHWKDTAIAVSGRAVRSFTLLFLQMWNVYGGEEHWQRYLDIPQPAAETQPGFVLPYGDSPLDQERVGEMVYIDILNRATRYVHIMSPYLILDGELQTALAYAAKRGVEVAIILPHVPDKKTAFALARNHYRELLAAGVQLYEYTPGFVHAKVVVSDDKTAVVGTINLDYRSLYHHFECAALLYDLPVIAEIEADVRATLQKCQRVTPETWKKQSLYMKVMGKVLRLIAPLM